MAKNENKDKGKVVELGNILEKIGKYQVMQYIYCCLPSFFVTLLTVNYVFVAGDINYRCRVRECEDPETVFSPDWWPDTTLDRCTMPVLNRTIDLEITTCSNNSFTGQIEECFSWIYENNNTIVAELNLACQPWKVNSVGTVHNLGMMFAMPITGWLADKFGRKPITVMGAVGGFLGVFKIFAPSYFPYIAIEWVEAAATGGLYITAQVLMMEITGTKARVVPGVLIAYSIYLGEAAFAGIAMAVPYWKHLITLICSPNILFLSFFFLLKESPRWLITNGKVTEAKRNLLNIAKTNNFNVDVDAIEKTDEETLKDMFKVDNKAKKVEFLDIVRSGEVLKRTFVAFFAKFGTNFIYYGLLVNSVTLPGNKYSNFLLSAMASFPGELLSMYLMNKIGRKKPLIYGYLTCGAFCLLCAVIPEAQTWLKLIVFLMAKLIVSACFTGLVTYAMELFPTTIRGSLCGFCTLASGLGSMLAPLTPILAAVYAPLPFILFACCAVIAGLLIIATPETRGMPLMDTLEQVNASRKLGKGKIGNDNSAYVDDNATHIKA